MLYDTGEDDMGHVGLSRTDYSFSSPAVQITA